MDTTHLNLKCSFLDFRKSHENENKKISCMDVSSSIPLIYLGLDYNQWIPFLFHTFVYICDPIKNRLIGTQ